MDIALAVGALVLLFVHLLSITLAAIRLKRTPRPNALSASKPPVSLIIPLRGIENFTALTVSRAFALDWPTYEIIFCVADRNDPVIREVQSQLTAHPQVTATVLIGDDRISANPKLNNCVKGWRAAAHDWVVLADSNVLMPSDYIATLMAAWRNDTGLVCSPPIGSRPVDLWAEVECCFLNTFQARYQYSAEALGGGFAQGKTMLWHKPFLNARGGIEALGAEIAEDAAATKLVRAAGLNVHLVSSPFEQPLGQRSLREIWSRQTRWGRLRRVTFPLFFAPEIFVGALPPLLLTVVALLLAGAGPTAVCAGGIAMLASFYLPELYLAKRTGWHISWRSLAAMMIRDLLLPAVWTKSLLGSSVSWRGNMMTVATDQSSLSPSTAELT